MTLRRKRTSAARTGSRRGDEADGGVICRSGIRLLTSAATILGQAPRRCFIAGDFFWNCVREAEMGAAGNGKRVGREGELF